MAATVYISETNGPIASPTTTDNVANLNFGSIDAPNIVPSLHPINVGSNGVTKWWRIKLAALGGSSQISNIKIWKSSGAYVTGEIIGGGWEGGNPNFFSLGYGFIDNPSTTPISLPDSGNGSNIYGGTAWSGLPLATSLPGVPSVAVNGVFGGAIVGVGYSNYQAHGTSTTASTPVGLVNQKVITIQYDEA